MVQPWDDGQKRKGFGSIRYYGGEYWGVKDPQFDEMRSKASVPSTAAMVAEVAENTPLGMMSDQDGGTWGAARYAGGSDKSFMQEIAEHGTTPPAYREVFAAAARAPKTIDSPGIRKAWYEVARLPWFQRLYWDRWFRQVLWPAWDRAKALGWETQRGIVTLARIRNSSPKAMERAIEAAKAAGGSEANQIEGALNQYASESDRYAERADEIRRKHPLVKITRKPQPTDLFLSATPRRQDGSLVSTSAPRADQQPGGQISDLAEGVGNFLRGMFGNDSTPPTSMPTTTITSPPDAPNDAPVVLGALLIVGYVTYRALKKK